MQALAGLYWFITRRKVRGWSRLQGAASESPAAYRLWVELGESNAYHRFRLAHPQKESVRILTLILGGDETTLDDVLTSLKSIKEAFGHSIPVYSTLAANAAGHDVLSEYGLESVSSLSHSNADWLLPVVAGDVLSPWLEEILQRALIKNGNALLAVWDEDRIIDGVREDPWIKPSWDAYLFSGCAGLVGASVVSMHVLRKRTTDILATINAVHLEHELLSMLSEQRERTVHVPLVLTHRKGPQNMRVRLPRKPVSWPKVSILIPTRDQADLLRACLNSLGKLNYPGEIELLLIDNGTIERTALKLLGDLEQAGLARIVRAAGAFNFSKLNNIGARAAAGEVLCLLNNDIEALDGEWLTIMVSYCLAEGIGAVGALLLYPDQRIQHAGVAIGLGGAAGHVQRGVHVDDTRFWTWHRLTREVSAVTAATMVLRKQSFLDVGGFDEEAFPIAFNDVDLCLRLNKAGLRNLFVAEARLIHHESVSRGNDRSPIKARRFAGELKALQDRWGTLHFEDPHFSPLFSKSVERCTFQF